MRKRTIKNMADTFLWSVVYLLPLIAYVVLLYGGFNIVITDIFNLGFNINSNHIVYGVIDSLFGASGILPLYDVGSFIPLYITYLSSVVIIQVAYDFVIFIPKLAHKYMHKFTQDE